MKARVDVGREAGLLIADNSSAFFEGAAAFFAAECGERRRVWNSGQVRPAEWDCPVDATSQVDAAIREHLRPVVLVLQPIWALNYGLGVPFFDASLARRITEAHEEAYKVQVAWGTVWTQVVWMTGAEDAWLYCPLLEDFLAHIKPDHLEAMIRYGSRDRESRIVLIGDKLAKALAGHFGWEFRQYEEKEDESTNQ